MRPQDGSEAYLNFGAGNPVRGWLNVDPSPLYRVPRFAHHALAALSISKRSRHFAAASYQYFRLAKGRGLPFAEASFEAVYCSHVLEHLPASRMDRLFEEFRRVTRPGGIVRVIVPDLKAALERALGGSEAWVAVEDTLDTYPPELRRSRRRAALEALAHFPSSHRTIIVPDNLEKALGDAWALRTGLHYLESSIDVGRLSLVEREDRCRDALIFELEHP